MSVVRQTAKKKIYIFKRFLQIPTWWFVVSSSAFCWLHIQGITKLVSFFCVEVKERVILALS